MTVSKIPFAPRYERGWFTVVHGLIGVLTLAALLLLAAPGWELAVKERQAAAPGLNPQTTAADRASPSQTGTGVPEASLVFRGDMTAPEPLPTTF